MCKILIFTTGITLMEKKPSTNKTQGVLQTTLITFRILSRYTNVFEEHSEPEIRAPNPGDQTIKKY